MPAIPAGTSNAGNHAIGNENYSAGWSSNETLRNFFVFDLSGIAPTETVLSVTLRLYNPAVSEPDVTYTGGYDSPDATETYTVREILLPAATVTAPSVLNPAVYTAIGAGASFGSYDASLADNGQFIDIAIERGRDRVGADLPRSAGSTCSAARSTR